MSIPGTHPNGSLQQWIVGRTDASGQFVAQVVGVPELHAAAASRAEAIEQIRALLSEWLASCRLFAIEVPTPNPVLHFADHLDPNDPLEKGFMEELARQRREDLEQTLREDDQECSNSSSIPTT